MPLIEATLTQNSLILSGDLEAESTGQTIGQLAEQENASEATLYNYRTRRKTISCPQSLFPAGEVDP